MNRILMLLALFLLPATAHAQLTPDEAMKKFTVADGLQIELFAAEPDVINPTSIDVDEKGRVWVCEAVNYRRKGFGRPILRKEGDRIVVLEDTNADGKADKSHVFYQSEELYGPLGIAVAPYPINDPKSRERSERIGYRVFVCQSPDILVFDDKDGDLKADGPPKKFLTGFQGFDHDHGVHGINIGPDGKLYFTVGDAGVKNLQSADGKGPKWTSNDKDVQKGTVWRCDMDGNNLELIAHNFRNNYECCVNSFGEVWLSDNDDDGNQQTRICFVMPGGNYGYGPRGPGQSHWHEEQPGIVHKVLRTGFGSPTGICFYEGNLLPEKYRGQLLHTDAGPRELRAFHLKPKGAGYEAEKEVLVTSSDNWFRLSDVCVAPDGSVIIADWYDPGVGGHGMGDWTRGRIYRVTPKGHQGYKVPEVQTGAPEGAIKALSSPNLASRWMGFQELAKLRKADTVPVLGPIIFGEGDGVARARAAYVAAVIIRDKDSGDLSKELIRDRDERLRAFAVRLADTFFDQVPNKESLRLTKDIGDYITPKPTAPVYREMLLMSRKLSDPAMVKDGFYKIAKQYDGQDHFYRAALNIACGTDPARRDAILADFDKHFPEWNDKVADLVWELRPKSVLPRLEKLLGDAKLTAAQKARIVDIMAASEDLAAARAMLTLLGKDQAAEIRDRALENLRLFLPGKWKGLAAAKEIEKSADELMADPNSRSVGLRLIAAAGLSNSVGRIKEIAKDEKEPIAVRKEAIGVLGKLKSDVALDTLMELGSPENPLTLACVQAIGSHLPSGGKATLGGLKALDALQRAVNSKKASQELKVAALGLLAGNQAGTQWLLDAAEKKQLPEDVLADAGKLLRNTPYQGLRNRALILFPAPGKLDPKKLAPPIELAKRVGNVEHGRKLFEASLKGEAQCMRCHAVRGAGGNIGPDLSMIGKKASKEDLYNSILAPSKAIADQYLQWSIENAAGQKILGLMVEEGPAGVTIRDANGKDTKIPKADIESRTKSAVSIMPEDVVKALTEDDLIDLVEYLYTLKSPSLTPDTWHVLGPFANDAKDSALGTLIGFESKPINLAEGHTGRDGEIQWGVIPTSATGYVDLTNHYRGKSANSASYLYRVIDSPAEQEATILLGNDDGAKLWVNGDKVFENREHLAAAPGKHKVPVKLKKGPNTILVKIVNGSDPHGMYFTIESGEELKLSK